MITQKQYDMLKEKYSDVASWAIWETPDINAGAKSNISDLGVFDCPSILNILNPNYIILGLNAAVHTLREFEPWMNFHSNDIRRSQDYKLRDVLQGTPIWGSYITDLIKKYPETFSSKVMSYVKHNQSILNENVRILRQEIEILGTNPILIALGNNTYKLLMQTSLPEQFSIKKITHYSATISKQAYKDEIQKVLIELNSDV